MAVTNAANGGPLRHYVVSYINFFDNDLKMQEVVARSWKNALVSAFCIWEHKTPNDFPHLYELPDNLENAKVEAFNQDWQFGVLITSVP